MGQSPLVMCSAVCSAPQSQQSLVDSPHRSMFAPNLPTPVRSLFSRVQARRDLKTIHSQLNSSTEADDRTDLTHVLVFIFNNSFSKFPYFF